MREGVPLRLNFDRQESGHCTSRVVFADFHASKSLSAFGTATLEFTPDKVGEFDFACGMNMIHGTLVVELAGGSGVIAVADTVKDESADAIATLRALGLQVAMITGDNARTAAAIARRSASSGCWRKCSPNTSHARFAGCRMKAAWWPWSATASTTHQHSLKQTSGSRSGPAPMSPSSSSDITLISGALNGVVTAITLSRATMRNIRPNLILAFVYNAIGIPIAAGVLYPFIGVQLTR